jgi:tRNA pseudouridine55 synthase
MKRFDFWMKTRMDGILLIDKEKGETSYDVVRKIKPLLRIPKVGHAGTLDPFATGLLIILLGRGTKLSPFVMAEDKVYLATLRLGIETDTLDPTGRIVYERTVPEMEPEFIRNIVGTFVGEINQVPPDFSAIKYKGSRAYTFARNGLAIRLKPRRVTIHSIRILSSDFPNLKLEVRCSSGTYIRSLAADIGRYLGTGGHLSSLRRLSSGRFKVQDALKSSEISNKDAFEKVMDNVKSLKDALPAMREIEVNNFVAKKIRNGFQPEIEDISKELRDWDIQDGKAKLVNDDDLVAIVKLKGNKGVGHESVRIERVFSG